MQFTPNQITELKANEIFVFGSNESGIHGAGAAKQAMKWGATWGQSYGLSGQTFAIPTKDASVYRTLSISKIKEYVDRFYTFAKNNSNLIFLVTEIGCGKAKLKHSEIGPLFANCKELENVVLPEKFCIYIK